MLDDSGSQDFRDNVPSDSHINDLIEWFERDDLLSVTGYIGERGDTEGQWETFVFDISDTSGNDYLVTLSDSDLGEEISWAELFDYLQDYADDNDIDYVNPYGE